MLNMKDQDGIFSTVHFGMYTAIKVSKTRYVEGIHQLLISYRQFHSLYSASVWAGVLFLSSVVSGKNL